MGGMEDRGYHHMSSYAFHQDDGGTPWVNLRWVRDVIEQLEAGSQVLRDINGESEQLAAIRRAAQAVDKARHLRRGD